MIKVGDIVRWTDWQSAAGWDVPREVVGLVINKVHEELIACPSVFEVMTSSGELLREYSDELEKIF